MASPRFQHSIQVPEDLEQAWIKFQSEHPDMTFNGFACEMLREALKEQICATI